MPQPYKNKNLQNLQNEVVKNVGNNLSILRRQHGLSQVDAARKIGCGQATLANWETGRIAPPLAALALFKKMYGVSLDDIILKRNEITVTEKGEIV